MNISKIFSVIILFICTSIFLLGQNISSDELEVWRLEEKRVEYIKSLDLGKFRAMYHKDFIGWPSQVNSPVGYSNLGYRIINALEEGKNLPEVKLRKEAVRIFDNIAIVHFVSSRNSKNDSEADSSNKNWIKVTHTWMRVGDTWKIVGGMAAQLPKEKE